MGCVLIHDRKKNGYPKTYLGVNSKKVCIQLKMGDEPLIQTRIFQVEYSGKSYMGPNLSYILSVVNSTIVNPVMHLSTTGMSLVVRGLSKRGFHKGASGSSFLVGSDFKVPPGVVWVGKRPEKQQAVRESDG